MNPSRTHPSFTTAGQPRLGVDIGRVIIHGDGPDTSFIGGSDADAMNAPAMSGAFEALTRLNRLFEDRVWLVSKCGPRIQARTRAWLTQQRFFEHTGIPPDHLHFCRERPEKAVICGKLRITCFVDDRVDVLTAMRGIVPHRLLFGAHMTPSAELVPVPDWREAERAILSATALVSVKTRETRAERAR
jgi:hypothetical protein